MAEGKSKSSLHDTESTTNPDMDEILKFIEERYMLIPKISHHKTPVSSTPITSTVPITTTSTNKNVPPVVTGAKQKIAFSIPQTLPNLSLINPLVSTPGSGLPNPFMASTPVPSVSIPHSVSFPPSILPKIPCFSGDEPLPKGEVPYVVWRYEVQCLLTNPDLTRSTVLQIIRGSLRGTARIMTVPLGQDATVVEILAKLDVMFSEASTKEDLLTQFFNSRQNPNESVTTYACRLETLLQSIIDKGQLPGLARNDILRHKFWTGLHSDMLKLQTRHKYDSFEDYNLLLREIRKVEKEIATNPTQTNISSLVPSVKHAVKHTPLSAGSSFEQQLSALENKIDSKISNIESKLSSFKDSVETNIDSKFNLILQKLENRGSYFRPSSNTNNNYRTRTNTNNNTDNNNTTHNNTSNNSNNNSNNNNTNYTSRFFFKRQR